MEGPVSTIPDIPRIGLLVPSTGLEEFMNLVRRGVLSAIVLSLGNTSAFATLLTAGHSLSPGIPLSGTNIGDPGDLRGTVVASTLQPFLFAGESGSVTSEVILQADNTYGFAWIVSVDNTSTAPIGSLRLGFFGAPFPLYGDFLLPAALGPGPTHAGTFTDGLVNFVWFDSNFDENLQPGQTSALMYLNPHASAYAFNVIYDVTSGSNISALSSTFGPAPEPSTLLLLAAGALSLAWRRWQS
jgi:hypothetical protein